MNQLSIKMRFKVIVTALLMGFTMFGVWTFYAMNTLNVNGPLYQRIIQASGCMEVQGYLISRPISAKAIVEFISTHRTKSNFKGVNNE